MLHITNTDFVFNAILCHTWFLPLLLESSSKGVDSRWAREGRGRWYQSLGPSGLDEGLAIGLWTYRFQFNTNVENFGQPPLQGVPEKCFQQCHICSH